MNKERNDLRKIVTMGIFGLLVFGIFYFMTSKTPLAGDDWGYALNGMKQNPLKSAWEFYFSWSGRVFSELWGFVVAPRKWLWNILNPLLFALIYLSVFKLAARKEKGGLISALLILTMMLNVNADIRMQTYTWIMGTTYVIPLAFSLIYFSFVFEDFKKLDEMPVIKKVIGSLLCFYIGLTMENIAAVMILAEIFMFLYKYFTEKKISGYLILSLALSTLSFIIMRSSPGSAFRLERDHAAFNALPLLEKFCINMPYFINYSFLLNKFTVFFFIVSLAGLVFFNRKKSMKYKMMMLVYLGVCVVILFILNISSVLHMDSLSVLVDAQRVTVWLYWILFVIIAFVIVFQNVEDNSDKWRIIFFITLAGCSNMVMLVSPIFGARSALYFVYFIIAASVLLLQEWVREAGKMICVLAVIMLALSVLRIREYYYKYTLVDKVQTEREQLIEYYRNHWEDKEIYIPRMPIFSIHSADIEEGDDYHFETFKEYYGLNPEAKVYFYWKDSY